MQVLLLILELEYEPSLPDPDVCPSLDDHEKAKDDLERGPVAAEESRKTTKNAANHEMDDYKTRGVKRPHRKIKSGDLSSGVLSIDLAGPYKNGDDGSKFILIAVLRTKDATTLLFVRALQRRFWSDVLEGINSIVTEMSALAGSVRLSGSTRTGRRNFWQSES